MVSDEPDEKKPLPEADRGNGPKPPRPTAVGTSGSDGGSDDDWENRISDLRGDDLEQWDLDRSSIESWIPNLSFVRILSRGSVAKGGAEQTEENLRDALTGLYAQKVNVAFLITGTATDVGCYMGVTPPVDVSGDDWESINAICGLRMKSLLNGVYASGGGSIEFDQKSYSAAAISKIIEPVAEMVGCVTGMPLPQYPNATGEIIARISDRLLGQRFGALVLAAPIPSRLVSAERFTVFDQIRHTEDRHPKPTGRVRDCLELLKVYGAQLQLGVTEGCWQVGFYYFASNEAVFDRLGHAIKRIFDDGSAQPTPIRAKYVAGLKPHLIQLGLLSSRRQISSSYELRRYHFVTPLHSRLFATYLQVPEFEGHISEQTEV